MVIVLNETGKFERRDRFEIMSIILSSCQKGMTRKTHIMYKCNLSHKELHKYLEVLTSLGHLRVKRIKGANFYQTTMKGEKFILEYQHVERVLEE